MKSEKWYAAMAAKKEKGTNKNQYTKAKSLGTIYTISESTREKFRAHMIGNKLSEETKKKISLSRIKFLEENPDMVPYKLNHYSKNTSYAELYWKDVLDANNINYISEYQVSRYHLDFAILDKKIDIEIDGDQHYLDKRIVESDIRRNKYLENIGWKIIRIKWSDYKRMTEKEKKEFINKLLLICAGM